MNEPRIIWLGAGQGPRLTAFQQALTRLGRPLAQVVSYHGFLTSLGSLEAKLGPGVWLRLDSPDRDPEVLQALYRAGAQEAEAKGYPVFAGAGLDRVFATKGHLGSPSQLFFGLRSTIRKATLAGVAAQARLSACPEEVALAFDKSACGRHLDRLGIPTPRSLGGAACFDELCEAMRRHKTPRVFVKLRHGSAAAGMVALAMAPDGRLVAHTTAHLGDQGEIRTSRRLLRLTGVAAVEKLIDTLAPQGLHVEAWVPKAGIAGGVCDLRVVTIDGHPLFQVLRKSRHPMTNLHLGGTREDPAALRARMSLKAWDAAMESCKAVARGFPKSLMLGIDLAVCTNLRSHAVLEVNAFGDHVKELYYQGRTPQEAQILSFQPMELAA